MKILKFTSALLISALLSSNANALSWMSFDQGNSPIPSNTVTAILTDGTGAWVGTDEGLAHYDGQDWAVYTSETSSLPDDYIHDIHNDGHGNTWIATNGGLLKIHPDGWESFDVTNSGLPSNLVRSVSSDSEGNLWIGTWGQGLASMMGNQWTVYNTSNSEIPSNGVFTVEVDELGLVWVGTFNGSASVFNGQTWTTYNTSNSELPQNHVRSITFDHSRIVWFGTDDGLARKTPGGHWDVFTFQNIGHSFHAVFDGVMETPGQLLFGTDGGLLAFNQFTFSMTTAQNSDLPSNNIRCMDRAADGNFWLGTGNAGMVIYSPEGTLAVDEQISERLSVYPNPAENNITVDFGKTTSEDIEIAVYNSVGQLIVTERVTNFMAPTHQLDLSGMAAGTYHLTVRTSNRSNSKTFYKL